MLKKVMFFGALVVFVYFFSTAAKPKPKPQLNSALLSTTLVNVHGHLVELERYQGQALVVNFWARWCGPCRDEIPLLAAYHDANPQGSVRVLGIALDEDGQKVADFAHAYEAKYPMLLVSSKQGTELMSKLGNNRMGLPFTLFINRDGKIVASELGAMNQQQFNHLIAQVDGR